MGRSNVVPTSDTYLGNKRDMVRHSEIKQNMANHRVTVKNTTCNLAIANMEEVRVLSTCTGTPNNLPGPTG